MDAIRLNEMYDNRRTLAAAAAAIAFFLVPVIAVLHILRLSIRARVSVEHKAPFDYCPMSR